MFDLLTQWMFSYKVLAAFILPVPILIWAVIYLFYITGEAFDKAKTMADMLSLCFMYIAVPVVYFFVVNLFMFTITQ